MPTTVTSTIRSSGGDYSLLSTWEAAKQGDLVTADQIQVAECYNDWPSGLVDTVTIDGSTTDSTRYLKITVAAGHRHDGTPSQSGFYLKQTASWRTFVNFQDAYSQVEWVEFLATSNDCTFVSVAGSVNAAGCVARNLVGSCTYGSNSGTGIYVSTIGNSITVINSIFVSLTHGLRQNNYADMYANNCVLAGNNYGALCGTSNNIVAKNIVAYNNATANYSGTFHTNSTNNATSTGSDDAPGGSSVYGVTSAAFVNAASNDFHLASGSVLIGAGVNLYSTFTTDIDGDTWPSSGAWDIGFDYRVSAGPTYTLTASNGSLALTGTASGIYSSRLLTAAQASLSLAGNATGLLAGRVVAASPGAFSLSGNAASLLAGRSLAATVGGFTYTGNAAGLTYTPLGGYSLAAETGSFSTIGNSAALNAARLLGASVGTFTLTGNAATLTYSPLGAYTLTADSGSFVLTGAAAGFSASRQIAAASGSFALTGNAASLLRGYALTGGTGAYILTGNDAALTYTAQASLLAEAGAFTLTGGAVTFTYSGMSNALLSAPRTGSYSNTSTATRSNLQTARRPRS